MATRQHDDGGLAFPANYGDDRDGMSLRDWFAGQVVAAEVNHYGFNDAGTSELARHAYRIADAMLKAREVSK